MRESPQAPSFVNAERRAPNAERYPPENGEIVTLSALRGEGYSAHPGDLMKTENSLQKIALALRKDPKKVRAFANRLQSIISKAKTSEEVSEHHWEWYAILTLWPPLEVIRLLEDSSPSATRLQRTCPLVSLLSKEEA